MRHKTRFSFFACLKGAVGAAFKRRLRLSTPTNNKNRLQLALRKSGGSATLTMAPGFFLKNLVAILSKVRRYGSLNK